MKFSVSVHTESTRFSCSPLVWEIEEVEEEQREQEEQCEQRCVLTLRGEGSSGGRKGFSIDTGLAGGEGGLAGGEGGLAEDWTDQQRGAQENKGTRQNGGLIQIDSSIGASLQNGSSLKASLQNGSSMGGSLQNGLSLGGSRQNGSSLTASLQNGSSVTAFHQNGSSMGGSLQNGLPKGGSLQAGRKGRKITQPRGPLRKVGKFLQVVFVLTPILQVSRDGSFLVCEESGAMHPLTEYDLDRLIQLGY